MSTRFAATGLTPIRALIAGGGTSVIDRLAVICQRSERVSGLAPAHGWNPAAPGASVDPQPMGRMSTSFAVTGRTPVPAPLARGKTSVIHRLAVICLRSKPVSGLALAHGSSRVAAGGLGGTATGVRA